MLNTLKQLLSSRLSRLPRAHPHALRRTHGSVTIFFLVVSGLLLLMATFSFALGQTYIANAQLQTVADAGSRAAVAMIRDGEFPLRARAKANEIAVRTRAIELGHFLADGAVVFGDYDYYTGVFTPGGNNKATAVKIDADRTSSAFLGPLEIAVGLYYNENTVEVSTSSIATFGCREVVFAIDVSGGMEEELDTALQLVSDFKEAMDDSPHSGDKIGLTFYAAGAASLREFSRSSGFWSGGQPDPLSQLSRRGVHIDTGLTAMGLEGTCQNFRDSLPGGQRGSCAGKGDNLGIDRALDLFDEMGTASCSVENERVIVLMSAGMPCVVFGPALNDFSTPYFGGTKDDAYEAADRAAARNVTIVPIHVDEGAPGDNNYCQGIPLAFHEPGIPEVYLATLARGWAETAILDPDQSDMEDLLDEVNRNLSIRVVE